MANALVKESLTSSSGFQMLNEELENHDRCLSKPMMPACISV